MKTTINRNGIILPAVLALICIIGIIVARTIKTIDRFHWLTKAVKQEAHGQAQLTIFDGNNPCKDATCLHGIQASHVISNEDGGVFSYRKNNSLPYWTAIKDSSTRINCDKTSLLANDKSHSSAYNCHDPLKQLIKDHPMVYFFGNYNSERLEEISDLKQQKITITAQGFIKINQLLLKNLENITIEILSVGPIAIDFINLIESKNVLIYVYSALGNIDAGINNQISTDCLKQSIFPGFIILEAKEEIKVNHIKYQQDSRCMFKKNLVFWPTVVRIGR